MKTEPIIPTTAKARYVWLTLVHVAAGVWAMDHVNHTERTVTAQSCCSSGDIQVGSVAHKVLQVFTPEEAESMRIASLPEPGRSVWSGYDGQLKRKGGK